MARMNPGRFAFGLVAEITGIVVIVSLLPKVPWGAPALGSGSESNAADRRPSLNAPPPLPTVAVHHWRAAVRRELEPETIPPVDPVYVERRLDRAGQQLLQGVSTYFVETAREVLEPPAVPAAPPSSMPGNLPSSFTSGVIPIGGNWRY